MKRSLIITAAGTSSRFRETLGEDKLKVIYYGNNHIYSLLYYQLKTAFNIGIDNVIIVAGYKFSELEEFVNKYFLNKNIEIIYNEKFSEWGSEYSLYLGLQSFLASGNNEAVFIEGDLVVDTESFRSIIKSKKNVVTSTSDPITADKSVVFYFNCDNKIKYIYDIEHKFLMIPESFISIHNSGQVWKFINRKALIKSLELLDDEELKGTNLKILERYYNLLLNKELEIIKFNKWFNCNTIVDYEDMKKYLESINWKG